MIQDAQLVAPHSDKIAKVVGEPVRVGSELQWAVELVDKRRGLLAALLPELARSEALRRRYIRDVERRASIGCRGLAAIEDRGEGALPWRLRAVPEGETLAQWLQRMAPAPIDRVAQIGSELADVLHGIHRAGMVVRDLHPRLIVLSHQGLVLTDVGLARVDLLSTRTAASLLLEVSPYAAPEQLVHTVIDQRADLFGLGVILFEALAAQRPYGDGVDLFDDALGPPQLAALVPGVPAAIEQCIRRCLERAPQRRPRSAAEVADVLRGHGGLPGLRGTTCQSCGAILRHGQRLCLSCGGEVTVFRHTSELHNTFVVVLEKINEDAATIAALAGALSEVSAGPVPALNFLVGHEGMYSKNERTQRIRLPAVLVDRLDAPTAAALAKRFASKGVRVRARSSDPLKAMMRPVGIAVGAVTALFVGLTVMGIATAQLTVMVTMLGVAGLLGVYAANKRGRRAIAKGALIELRPGARALPASDPWVTRIAALVGEDMPADVRRCLDDLALEIQRLVDHRASLKGSSEQAELQMLTEPLDRVLELVTAEVGRLGELDQHLQSLDEGVLVRGLAALEARGATATERETLLESLDRLRSVEDLRAAAFGRLLEIAALIRRTVALGLDVRGLDPLGEP